MKKYIQIIKDTWAQYMEYRLNFVLWRVRQVIQILVVYFLWHAIFSDTAFVFGYTQSMILSYVMLSSIVRTIVLSTTTMEIGEVIHEGKLSNYLLRPLSPLRFYFGRDIGDKALNLMFSLGEVSLLFLLLRPPVYLQSNPVWLILACIAVCLGAILYFHFSLLMGFLGFWIPDVWAPRFLFFVVMEFLAGGLFPLDILPKNLYVASQFLPFGYFIYFPLKVYLGQLSNSDVLFGFGTGIFWVSVLYFSVKIAWAKGLRVYTAEGR